MKKVFIAVIALLVMATFAFAFAACGAEQPDGDEDYEQREGYYTVIFDTDGGSAIARQYVAAGGKAERPSEDPTKSTEKIGTTTYIYEFDGWYVGDDEYDFDSEITQNITIKAKWKVDGYGSDLPIIK